MQLNNNININLSQIVDDEGNKRFVEGNGTTYEISGVTFTYSEWSLSGSHLMFVICGSVENTTIGSDVSLTEYSIPDWIYNKITPVFRNTYIEIKQLNIYANDLGDSQMSVYLLKANNKIYIYNKSSLTVGTARHFKIQFDLMID